MHGVACIATMQAFARAMSLPEGTYSVLVILMSAIETRTEPANSVICIVCRSVSYENACLVPWQLVYSSSVWDEEAQLVPCSSVGLTRSTDCSQDTCLKVSGLV